MNFDVEFYEEESKSPVFEFINELDDKTSCKIYRIIKWLTIEGNMLGEPHSKHLEDGIFELRIQTKENNVRLFYFFMIDKKIIITNGCLKKDQKTPRREIELSKKRREYYLRRNKQYEI